MANLKDIIYLSNADYETLASTGTVTIDGTTLTYDESNIYITPDQLATTTSDGLMSAEDKRRINGLNNYALKDETILRVSGLGTTTLADLVSTYGGKTILLSYSGQDYLGRIGIYVGSTYFFEFEMVGTSIRYAHYPVSGTLTLAEIFTNTYRDDYLTSTDGTTIIASAFSTTTSYNKGDLVIRNNVLYRAKNNLSAGAWNNNDWDATKVSTELKIKSSDVETNPIITIVGFDANGNLAQGSVPTGTVTVDDDLSTVSENPVQNKVITSALIGIEEDIIASAFDITATYNKGDLVIYSNTLYKAKSNLSAGAWNSDNWESTEIGDELELRATIENLENGQLVANKSHVAEQIENVGEESGSTQENPFTLQATATDGNTTETSTAPIAKHIELQGNCIVFNQLAKLATANGTTNNIVWSKDATTGAMTLNGTSSSSSYTYIVLIGDETSVATYTTHKYLIKWNLTGTKPNRDTECSSIIFYSNSAVGEDKIVNGGASGNTYTQFSVKPNATVNFTVKPQIFDLTLMFGPGKEPTSVVEFNRLFTDSFYSYNSGEIKSASSTKLTTIGYNQFDELWTENKCYNAYTGAVENNNRFKISTNLIKVIAGQTYSFALDTSESLTGWQTSAQRVIVEFDANGGLIKYNFKANSSTSFSTPWSITLSANTHYVGLALYNGNNTRPNSKVAFNLTWDSSKTGYEAYIKNEYSLPNVELKSAINCKDSLSANGKKITRIGRVNLGSLNWDYRAANNTFRTGISGMKAGVNGQLPNIICSKFSTVKSFYGNDPHNYPNNSITSWATLQFLGVINTDYDDPDDFKTAMDGVYAYYELATPVEEDTGNVFTENIEVDDFGTMEFNSVIPQGNKIFYPADYVLLLDDLNEYTNGNISSLALNSVVGNLETLETNNVDSIVDSINSLKAVYETNIKGMLRHQLATATSLDFANVGVVDLGYLSWTYDSTNKRFYSNVVDDLKSVSDTSIVQKLLCPVYDNVKQANVNGNVYNMVSSSYAQRIYIANTTYTSGASFKLAMTGVFFAYEKA